MPTVTQIEYAYARTLKSVYPVYPVYGLPTLLGLFSIRPLTVEPVFVDLAWPEELVQTAAFAESGESGLEVVEELVDLGEVGM